MSRITWAAAWPLLNGLFIDKPDTWPERLAPEHLARLQTRPSQGATHSKDDWARVRAMREAIDAACKQGELTHQRAQFVLPPLVLGGDIDWTPAEWDAHMRRLREDAPTKDWPAILAADFVRWLQAERAKPSEHVVAWVAATANRKTGTASE